jgi:hypothetical protein
MEFFSHFGIYLDNFKGLNLVGPCTYVMSYYNNKIALKYLNF